MNICPKCKKPLPGFKSLSGFCNCPVENASHLDAMDKLTQLRAQLATANDTIAYLTDELAINKNAYGEWYKRCLVIEAERDELREAKEQYSNLVDSLTEHNVALTDALRPFADAWPGCDNGGWNNWGCSAEHYKAAHALLGDDKEPDCAECDVLESPEGCPHPEGYNTSDDENTGWDITKAGPGCPKRKAAALIGDDKGATDEGQKM